MPHFLGCVRLHVGRASLESNYLATLFREGAAPIDRDLLFSRAQLFVRKERQFKNRIGYGQ